MTVTKEHQKRDYDSRARQAAAQKTRRTILDSARVLFLSNGYVGTTMPAIAKSSGLALDTIYATVGKKSVLFRLLVETAISGADESIPAQNRDYVQFISAEPDAAQKLKIYATALRHIQPRLAPLFLVLQAAAPLDADLQALWQEISLRRASNMRLLVKDIAATGKLRKDVSEKVAADIIWSMNSPEFYLLLVAQRGWSPEEFESWLATAWVRLLLVSEVG